MVTVVAFKISFNSFSSVVLQFYLMPVIFQKFSIWKHVLFLLSCCLLEYIYVDAGFLFFFFLLTCACFLWRRSYKDRDKCLHSPYFSKSISPSLLLQCKTDLEDVTSSPCSNPPSPHQYYHILSHQASKETLHLPVYISVARSGIFCTLLVLVLVTFQPLITDPSIATVLTPKTLDVTVRVSQFSSGLTLSDFWVSPLTPTLTQPLPDSAWA